MSRTRTRWTASLVATLAVAGSLVSVGSTPSPAAAQAPTADNPTIVVNSTGDGADASGADGVCATAGGDCTLRAAIQQANYNRGADRIEFAIGGSGVRQISPSSGLPTINDPTGGLTIDGYSQPGASPNTAADGSNAQLRVEVRGSGSNQMFLVESAENTIRGLAIFGGVSPIELRGEGADGNLVVGNFIGTNATGSYTRNGGTGIQLNLGPDRNRIGTPSLADRNVISGNGRLGIRVNHGETSENRIQNNVVGLSPDGTADLGHSNGIDIQWWTWGNLIGGLGPDEGNVVSGNGTGIDLSHKATGNLILGNRVGTTLDGRSANPVTRNGRGLIFKDDAEGNYYEANVVAGGTSDYAIWHKHNYTGGNTLVGNRIGVGVDGSDIGNNRAGMLLRGHDDVYHGNTFANLDGSETILISNTSVRDAHTYEPDEQTVRNAIRQGTYHGNANPPIEFGTTCCPHPDEDSPAITGIGPGQVNGDSTCAGCEVEVYASGTINGDGTVTPGTGTAGRTWIGTVFADGSGRWSMASPALTVGTRVSASAITPGGEVSDFSPVSTVPAQGTGLVPDPDQPTTPPAPPRPSEPPIYQPEVFTCSWADGVLTWDDAGAPEYYVFAVDDGTETYLGGHSATSLTTGGADGWRVEHWVRGIATNATCDGPGPGPGPGGFTCSYADGVLTWDDAGAPEYYVFAVDDGTETYLGGHSATSLTTGGADGWRVEHWITGQVTNATCDGPGPDPGPTTFSCSYADGVLTWDDAGAPEYYVFATPTPGGNETYLGGHSATSLTVAGADSYRVEHWITGQVTNATCDGDGAEPPPGFSCSFAGGTLTWDDAGAAEYYVFATVDGTEGYLGGHATTSLAVPGADSYRVEHWITGQAANATCGGDGGPPPFSCSVTDGVLSWDDAGAVEYYVFATPTPGAAETYLGGHAATSLAVDPADSWRVEHWVTGQATNATCSA